LDDKIQIETIAWRDIEQDFIVELHAEKEVYQEFLKILGDNQPEKQYITARHDGKKVLVRTILNRDQLNKLIMLACPERYMKLQGEIESAIIESKLR